MEAHRGHPKSLELQRTDDAFRSHQRKRRPPSMGETDVANAALIKLQRKLEAQGKNTPPSVALRIALRLSAHSRALT